MSRFFHLACLALAIVGGDKIAGAEESLFDPVAARMLRLSAELAGGHEHVPLALLHRTEAPRHAEEAEATPVVRRMAEAEPARHQFEPESTPAPVLKHLPDPTPTASLAKPTTTLSADEQKAFGPRSGGRRYDPRMIQAARLAKRHAEPKMTYLCWRYVKEALLEAGVVDSRPTTAFAKQAGRELCEKYGFIKLPLRSPLEAPVGAVVVYGGADAGHVELRTESGFVSDFVSRTPYPRPLVGVFVKPS